MRRATGLGWSVPVRTTSGSLARSYVRCSHLVPASRGRYRVSNGWDMREGEAEEARGRTNLVTPRKIPCVGRSICGKVARSTLCILGFYRTCE